MPQIFLPKIRFTVYNVGMSDFLGFFITHLPWFWLIVMVLCIVVEAVTFSLTTVWAAVSAFVMIFLSRAGLPFRWQLLVFFVLTLVLLLFTRPFAVRKLKLGKVTTNVNSLDGQEVLVVRKISKFEKGEVRAANGVVWTATAEGDGEIPERTVCVVSRVEGNTLVVREK